MSVQITRPTFTDDDGTGSTGTVVNAAWYATVFDAIDDVLEDFDDFIQVTGNAGLPTAVGANRIVIAGGFGSPDSGRIYLSAGGQTGWEMHISTRTGSTDTDIFTFNDRGWMVWEGETNNNPTTAELAANNGIALYTRNNKIVFAFNNAGAITFAKFALDGSNTAWVQDTNNP